MGRRTYFRMARSLSQAGKGFRSDNRQRRCLGARCSHPNPHAATRKSLKSNAIIMSRILRKIIKIGSYHCRIVRAVNMLIERRRTVRTRVVQPAKIIANDTGAAYGCIVDNLNTLGACVSFNDGTIVALPDNFDLTFDNCHTFWSCSVIWRNTNVRRVGVTWKIG